MEGVYLFLFSRQFLSPPETKAGQATLIAEPVSGRRKGKLEQYIARSGARLIGDKVDFDLPLLSPNWREALNLTWCKRSDHRLLVELWDWNRGLGDDFLGRFARNFECQEHTS